MAVKTPTKGISVKHGTSATPTDVLANVKTVRVKPGIREMIKSTDHAATNTDSYVPRPIRDTADAEIVIFWDPDDTGHEAVRAAHAAGTKYYFTTVFPNVGASQYALAGYITDFSPGEFDTETGLMEATIVFKCDGVEAFTV